MTNNGTTMPGKPGPSADSAADIDRSRPVTVITGGAGGMGLATAKIVGREHQLLLSDLSQDRLTAAAAELSALGIEADTLVCDVTDVAALRQLMDRASSAGRVAAVIHTAGVSPQMAPSEQILRINTIGTVNVTEAFLPVASPGACLVNVASTAAHGLPSVLPPTRAYPLASTDRAEFLHRVQRRIRLIPEGLRPGMAYAVSKHFVVWYSVAMAKPFGRLGARVVSVSPGTFDTAMGRLEEKSGSSTPPRGPASSLRRSRQ